MKLFACYLSEYIAIAYGCLHMVKRGMCQRIFWILAASSKKENLQPLINPGVEYLQEMIQSLAADKNSSDYTSAIYVNMPWYRITDEAIVRAVQARIYREVEQGDDTAAKQLLDRKGSVANLYVLYESLAEYESQQERKSGTGNPVSRLF